MSDENVFPKYFDDDEDSQELTELVQRRQSERRQMKLKLKHERRKKDRRSSKPKLLSTDEIVALRKDK
jgi:hypothetical protein